MGQLEQTKTILEDVRTRKDESISIPAGQLFEQRWLHTRGLLDSRIWHWRFEAKIGDAAHKSRAHAYILVADSLVSTATAAGQSTKHASAVPRHVHIGWNLYHKCRHWFLYLPRILFDDRGQAGYQRNVSDYHAILLRRHGTVHSA